MCIHVSVEASSIIGIIVIADIVLIIIVTIIDARLVS